MFFVLIFLGFYLLVIFAFSRIEMRGKSLIYQVNNYFHWKGGDTYYKFKDFKKDSIYDFVFVGSSRAYRGYNPFLFEQQGFSSWNLGSNAQSMENSLEVIKHCITKGNCKLLVVDIYPSALKVDGFESSTDLIRNIESTKAAFSIAFRNKDIRLVNCFMNRLLTLDAPPVFETEDYIGKGFCSKKDSLSASQISALKKFTSREVKSVDSLQESNLLKLGKVVDFCKLHNIPLVFVFSPTSDAYPQVYYESHIQSLKPFLENKKVTLLDYAKKLEINSYTEFYDDSHMNEKGVKIFNEVLIKDLKEIID